MQVRIVEKHFGGVEFCPEMKMLHLGGQSSANVERLEFILPESWQGKSVTLHIQRQDGTMPSPILLDENNSCAVGKEFTASPCGQWMLLALGEDGFRALTRPAKYDCYETLATDGDAEISPTQYETFVAQVVGYANAAQNGAKEARNAAAAAKRDANKAEAARMEAATAASEAGAAQSAAKGSASRAEMAAARAELTAPSDGAVRSVNGKGGVVTLTAEDLGAVGANSAGYVKSISLTDRTLTLTFGDGSTKTMQTKDTTTLENMTGILPAAHGGTGKNTPLTAEDVGAVEKGSGDYLKGATLQDGKLVLSFGNGSTVSYGYSLPTAASGVLGGVKLSDDFTVDADGTLHLAGGDCPFEVGDFIHTTNSVSPAARWGGTWEEVAQDRVLMGASSTHAAGTTAEAGLPNITGSVGRFASAYSSNYGVDRKRGALSFSGEGNMGYYSSSGSGGYGYYIDFNASSSNAIYGRSSTVQPAAYYVYIWHRVA